LILRSQKDVESIINLDNKGKVMASNPITHPIRQTLENAEKPSVFKGFLVF
jgi:hypothetical protein